MRDHLELSARRGGAAAFGLAVLMLSWGAAQAAQLQLVVSKADGQPAADVVVVIKPVGAWSPPPAGEPVVVNQKDMRFVPYVSVVPMGGTLRLTNQDRYDHHVRSMAGGPLGNLPPAKTFEVRLPGTAKGGNAPLDLKMDGSIGAITLGCHIHGSMRGHVYVSPTPWAAVSDDKGRVRIDLLPEGAAELQLWHPDELLEQPVQRVQVLAAEQTLSVKLNFTPKPRRNTPPPTSHHYPE